MEHPAVVVERQEKREVKLGAANLLFESELFARVLESEYESDSERETAWRRAEEYALTNELTAAFEVVTNGKISETYKTFDHASGQSVAFGESVATALRRGAEQPGIDEFERRRRESELAEAGLVDQMFASGVLKNQKLLVISPYPDEAPEARARHYGYDPDRRSVMVRLHEQVGDDEIKTVTIKLAGSDTRQLRQLARSFGAELPEDADSHEILSTLVAIDKSVQIEDVAASYDALLETDGQNYFCGDRVDFKSDGQYTELQKQRIIMENRAAPLITRLVDFDKDLAENMVSGRISRHEAEHDKADELIRTWSALSILLNRERAEEVFGKDEVSRMAYQINQSLENPAHLNAVLDGEMFTRMVQKSAVSFIGCGMMIGGPEDAAAIGEQLEGAKSQLFGGSTMSSESMKCVNCPFCKKTVDAKVTHDTISCPECKKTVNKQTGKVTEPAKKEKPKAAPKPAKDAPDKPKPQNEEEADT